LEIKVVHCEGDVTPLQAYYIALETLKHVPVKSGRFQVTIRLLHVTETKGRIEVALGSSDLQISFVSVQDWEWARPGAELTAMGCAEADLVGKIRSWQRESAIPARREEKQ
jgi:hypothetical protein